MASILLDIDGVLHVSGDPIPGASEAVSGLRRAGHALRFVTNNSTQPRLLLADELREMGFELTNDELQTTTSAAAREREGKRVLALVMPTVVPDLDALELVGHDADAVLVGGCDESLEPNQVFSYMNLARAFFSGSRFAEIVLEPRPLRLGDGKARTWAVPVALRDMDKRTFRIVPTHHRNAETGAEFLTGNIT